LVHRNILEYFPKQQARLLKRLSKRTEKRFKKLENYSMLDVKKPKQLTLDFIKKLES